MDSSDHPVVQRGIKAAELISDVSDEGKPLIQKCKPTCFHFFHFGGLKSFDFVSVMRFLSVHVLADRASVNAVNVTGIVQEHSCSDISSHFEMELS